jgi:hypothetical protein
MLYPTGGRAHGRQPIELRIVPLCAWVTKGRSGGDGGYYISGASIQPTVVAGGNKLRGKQWNVERSGAGTGDTLEVAGTKPQPKCGKGSVHAKSRKDQVGKIAETKDSPKVDRSASSRVP